MLVILMSKHVHFVNTDKLTTSVKMQLDINDFSTSILMPKAEFEYWNVKANPVFFSNQHSAP